MTAQPTGGRSQRADLARAGARAGASSPADADLSDQRADTADLRFSRTQLARAGGRAREGGRPGGELADRFDALRRELTRLARSRHQHARTEGARITAEAVAVMTELADQAARVAGGRTLPTEGAMRAYLAGARRGSLRASDLGD